MLETFLIKILRQLGKPGSCLLRDGVRRNKFRGKPGLHCTGGVRRNEFRGKPGLHSQDLVSKGKWEEKKKKNKRGTHW